MKIYHEKDCTHEIKVLKPMHINIAKIVTKCVNNNNIGINGKIK